MFFASRSAWVSAQDDLDEEEVYEEDLAAGLPAAQATDLLQEQPLPPPPEASRAADLPPIEESPDEMYGSMSRTDIARMRGVAEEVKTDVQPPESSQGFHIPTAPNSVPSAPAHRRIAASDPAHARRRPMGQVYRQQVDSNVVDIPLNVLKEETPIATGDPQFCSKCHALLSSISTLERREDGVYRWVCEFCGEACELRLDEAEVPKTNKLTYVTVSAAEVASEKVGAQGQSTVIFVVDTSGSMCVTQPAPGTFALKTSHIADEFRGLLHYDEADQFFEGWDRNTTYISRLQCVQAAIEAQILDVFTSDPERHVGLITFSDEVHVIGDGSTELILAGDKLTSVDSCLREVQGKYTQLLGRSVSQSKDALLTKVTAMEEKGPTALGPAALVAIALAKEGGAGSRVILCTDGIANVGLGSLEEAGESGVAFYQQLGDLAKEASVSVSILSIEGEECKLNALLPLAVSTGGDVNKVNPLKIREDFANVLASKTVATSVEITVSLHKALQFRNADPQSLHLGGSRLVRTLGTVCENESFIFEFCRKPLKQLQDEGVDVTSLRQLPFQVLVRYRRSDGMMCVFADTQVKDVTSDREFAMQNARFDILSRNAQQVSSNLAMQGRYMDSHLNTLAWGQAMSRNQYEPEQVASTDSYYQSSAPLYEGLREEMAVRQDTEQRSRAANQSDSVALAAHKQQRGSRR